ncbi:DUF2730 domain-containing protein, partial [Salmonella enterica subsp. enterica serovar Montevideo]|nr:DUF2730 domain-containing protein [Salmonella enterica subsp. enterica serovar Montevideo]ECT2698826.1 DUF2730 domain-containing protein [Salmonella enterica subsp. enterica serovar Montevideo]ECT7850521.1 DUF2730 domain-containing protein [Salmonella enterica subsp. enterica serovar Montevideo]ECX1185137.1 DUF2730 domain-containing protein [Salmonella enterica subsp. enterica serovar Montevideo]EDO6331297.1 DUF2730 domain-containing protein [Salmonella enterica subsp. enterica serovar Monte
MPWSRIMDLISVLALWPYLLPVV